MMIIIINTTINYDKIILLYTRFIVLIAIILYYMPLLIMCSSGNHSHKLSIYDLFSILKDNKNYFNIAKKCEDQKVIIIVLKLSRWRIFKFDSMKSALQFTTTRKQLLHSKPNWINNSKNTQNATHNSAKAGERVQQRLAIFQHLHHKRWQIVNKENSRDNNLKFMNNNDQTNNQEGDYAYRGTR